MKVLVTGASGFLGGYIVEACLRQGDHVRVLVRRSSNVEHLRRYPEIEYCYGSLTEPEAINEATRGVDVVYHSAARVVDYGSRKVFWAENVKAAEYVLKACQLNKVQRLVYISSPSVVFDYTDQIGIDESYPYPDRPASLYCETKAAAERMVLGANGVAGVVTVSLRPHAIWGPRDKGGFFPRIVSRICAGKFKKIVGKKEALIDLCYVQNAADACVLAAVAPNAGGKAYFISDGEALKIWDVVDRVCHKLGLPEQTGTINKDVVWAIATAVDYIWKIPFVADRFTRVLSRYSVGVITHSTTYDISAAKRDLGYEPKYQFADGLNHLKTWIEESGGLEKVWGRAG